MKTSASALTRISVKSHPQYPALNKHRGSSVTIGVVMLW